MLCGPTPKPHGRVPYRYTREVLLVIDMKRTRRDDMFIYREGRMDKPAVVTVDKWPGYVLADPARTAPALSPEFEQQGVWLALEQVVAPCWRPDFMFMGVFDRAGEIHSYKHTLTREYLNVDRAGPFYVRREGRYERIERADVCRLLIPRLSVSMLS